MTPQNNESGTSRRTLTQYLGVYGLEYKTLYADDPARPPVDPSTDWAMFAARDSFMAWEMLHCYIYHIQMLKGLVPWDEKGDIVVPLSDIDIPILSVTLKNFWRDFDDKTKRFRTKEGKFAPAGRIARSIYQETISGFLWHWEESYGDYNESYWPAQWTHEFPLALAELLRTLDKEAAMLAGIAGTSQADNPERNKLAGFSLAEHIEKYDLKVDWIEYDHPSTWKLLPQDIYTAAYLAWLLDNAEKPDGQDPTHIRNQKSLSYVFRTSAAIYLVLDAALNTWYIHSRMSNVLTAFIHDVVIPVLKHPTEDVPNYDSFWPHYVRFETQLQRLHSLARDLAGEQMRLFSGETGDSDAGSAPDGDEVP